MTKKKHKPDMSIGGFGAAQQAQSELQILTDRIASLYKLKNGQTALYWDLIGVINNHAQAETYNKLDKSFGNSPKFTPRRK